MTSYLSEQQITQFDQQGFLLIPGAIDRAQVLEMTEGFARVEQSIVKQHGAGHIESDILFDQSITPLSLGRINQLYRYMPNVVLALLRNNAILGAVEALCGDGALPVYESLLYKHLGSSYDVIWHQDMLHPRDSRIVTCGLYLDDASVDEGALQVIPGSQHQPQRFSQAGDAADFDQRAVPLSVSAGDLLIHDVMVLHDSLPLQAQQQRRTLYMEFRSLAHLQNNPRYPSAWVEQRQQLMSMAQQDKLIDAEVLYRHEPRVEPANYGMADIEQSG